MKITKDLNLSQVVRDYPATVPVFLRHGLMCIGCAAARFESIEQGALAHGLDVDALITDLNEAVTEKVATA